jgi:S-adenosylmethionine-diacylgycerolhomoserine-N-methlytransferase
MDRMYRLTRHVYDASRKYYLLGRDHLICEMDAQSGEAVLEVGCGTARNLIEMTKTYPQADFYGLDASEEMLKTAHTSIKKRGFEGKIKLAQAYAQNFEPLSLFGINKPFDKIVFSYALSIIPPWKESIDHALALLPKGAQMHIVDFGAMDGQPAWFQKLIFWWLSLFHVYHKPEILNYLKQLESDEAGALELKHLYRGYAYLARFTKA